MKSIIQTEKECFLCHTTSMLEEHHIFGAANRKHSETYGLKIFLCRYHHEMVHRKKALALKMHKIGQMVFEKQYGSRSDFMAVFGRSYL